MNTRIIPELGNEPAEVLEIKPFKHIEKLIDNVLPYAERRIVSKGDIVHYYDNDVRQCFLLIQGSVALHRRGDGIVLNSESSPFLLGVCSNLWEHFSKLLIYTASRVYEHCSQISQMSAYDIIRFQLVELMQEPEAIRQNITAAAYIKSRTYLSRSGVMRILAELRTGKYITMERGVLIDIHHLPRKY